MAERGWPSFMDGIDERMQKARESSTGTPPEQQPDPARPAGWQLPVDEAPASPYRATDSAWVIAGGTAAFLGSLLPFVSFNDPGMAVNPGARATTALFGLTVLGLGIALRAASRRFLMGTSVAALCLGALGAFGYAITIVVGLAGITEQDPFGDSVRVTMSPGIGIVLALAGCAAASVGGIRTIQHYRS
jgi:hypothetical protein